MKRPAVHNSGTGEDGTAGYEPGAKKARTEDVQKILRDRVCSLCSVTSLEHNLNACQIKCMF